MAPGYEIALSLEGLGLLCLLASLWRLRTEEHARASELKNVLRAAPVDPRHAAPRRTGRREPTRMVPQAQALPVEAPPSAALVALQRAFPMA